MREYRKRPVIVQAIQYTGLNEMELVDWARVCGVDLKRCATHCDYIVIPTLEGDMNCSIGSYLIKGVNGEFYPCKPDVFDKTYDEVTVMPKGSGVNIEDLSNDIFIEITKLMKKKDNIEAMKEPKFKVVGRTVTMGLASGHGKTHIFSDMYSVPGDFKEINEKYDWDGSERGVSL